MVTFVNEEKAKVIFSKYGNVYAFTTERTKKGIQLDDGNDIPYHYLDILPDTDALIACASGHGPSKKKLTKKFLKKLFVADGKTLQPRLIELHTILHMIVDRKNKKSKYPIVVFVHPDADSKEAKKLNDLIEFIIGAIFNAFGFELYNFEGKKGKKLFKGLFGKGKKKKVIRRVRKFIEQHDAFSSEGEKFYHTISKCNKLELAYANIQGLSNDDIINSIKLQKKLAYVNSTTLLNALSNPVNKDIGKAHRKSYSEIVKILGQIAEAGAIKLPKMPKVKKIKAKKFINFYMKRDNRALAMFVIAHMANRRLGVETGSKEYAKNMSPFAKSLDIHNAFNAYSKELYKLENGDATTTTKQK